MATRRPANESKSKRNASTADSQTEPSSRKAKDDNKVKGTRETTSGGTSNKNEPSTSSERRKNEKDIKSRVDTQIQPSSSEPKGDTKVKGTKESTFGSTSNKNEPTTSRDRRNSEKEDKSKADRKIETISDRRKSEKDSKSRAESKIETSSSEPKGDNKVKSMRESIFGRSSNKKESITSSDWRKNEEKGKSRADSQTGTRSSEPKGDNKAKSVAEYQRTSETDSDLRSSIEFTYSSLRYTIHSAVIPEPDYGIKNRTRLPKLETLKLLVAFWIFGLCNNVGYIVMLTAAEDILAEITNSSTSEEGLQFKRDCNPIGTGAVVVANVAPSIIVKIIAPFLPLMVHVRLIIVVILTAFGFLSAAMGYGSAQGHWLAIFGVIVISFANGLGESTLLAYTVFFSTKNVLSTWSSGTGAAGIVGALIYSLLRQAHVDVKNTLLIMLIWPMVMATIFWDFIEHPYIKKSKIHFSVLEEATQEEIEEEIPTVEDVHTIAAKLQILKRILCVYIAPYSLAFFFEYLINLSMYETLHYPDTNYFTEDDQYRWYMSIYLVGVFIARSSMNCLRVNNLWLLTLLQVINAIVIFFEVLYGFLHFVLVCSAFIFWEGLIAGTSYVNTYRRISSELPPLQREFSMSMNTFSDAIMITLAGSIAIPLRNYLCNAENPYEEKRRLQRHRM